MIDEYTNFNKFKDEFVKIIENKKICDLEDLEKFETIKMFTSLCNNFYNRVEKSRYKKEILKIFDDICKCINENDKMNLSIMNNGIFNSVISDINKALEFDSISIYRKFLNDEPIIIDSESDLKFYEFVNKGFNDSLY